MINYDAIIFDLDGTLWNAAGATVKSWNDAINDLGILSTSCTKNDIENVSVTDSEMRRNVVF